MHLLVKMIKRVKRGHAESRFLDLWFKAQLDALYANDAPLLELSSWKDILFVYQLTCSLNVSDEAIKSCIEQQKHDDSEFKVEGEE